MDLAGRDDQAEAIEPEAGRRWRCDHLALLSRVADVLIHDSERLAEEALASVVFGEVARAIDAERYLGAEPLPSARDRPIVIEDLERASEEGTEPLRAAGYRAFARFPLVAGDGPLGSIAFATRGRSRFAEGEIELVQKVCDQVAATLERTRAVQRAAVERWEAEARLHRSEQRYRSCVAATGAVTWTCPPDGLHVEAQPSWMDFTGQTADEMLGAGWTRAVHPDDATGATAAWNEAASRGARFSHEHRIRRHDGEWRWMRVTAVPIRDETGQITEWSGMNLDITDQRRTELALRTSEERLRRIGDNLPDSAIYQYVHEPDGTVRFLYMSAGIEKLSGVTAEAVLEDASVLIERVLPEHLDRCRQMEVRSRTTLSDFDLELPMRGPDGSVRWMRLHSRPRQLPDGRTIWEGVQVDVTARKETEDALARERDRYRRLFENMSEGFALAEMIWDEHGKAADFRYLEVNRAWEEQTGVPVSRTVGRTARAVNPPIEPGWIETYGRVVETGEPVAYESYAKGFGKWFETSAFKHSDSCFGLFFRDVTERKRGEDALRTAGESFRKVIERSPFGIYVVDADLRLAMVSVGAGKAFENARPLIGRGLGEVMRILWPERFASEVIERFRHTLATGEPYRSSDTVERRADRAETEAYDWQLERVVLPDGRPGVVCHFYDLSERQRYEDALRVATTRLETAIDASQVALFQQDRELRYTWVHNPSPGYAARDMLGKRDRDIAQRPEDAASAEAIKRSVLETGVPQREEITFVQNGEPHHYDLVVQPSRDASGEIDGVTCAAIDVTHRKQIEEQLREADQRKNEFLATLAHELRNPLAPIGTALQIMKMAQFDAAAAERYRSMMERQVERMTRLIDDLMDVARITRGKILLQKARIRVSDAVEDAVDISRPLIDARRHELIIDLPPESIEVEGDLTRLSQVLANLLNNAAKYTDPGGRIRLRVEREGSQVVARVEDNGIGIAGSMLGRVFDMFAQVHQTLDRAQGGLGIGLALAKRLVELHGGTISAESPGPGRGSTFSVRLPALVRDPIAPGQSVARTEPAAIGRRVLVVDDNPDAAETLADLLRLSGHDARTAHDGPAALAIARMFAPEIVFCDLGMPGMDGIEVARHLRADPATCASTLVALTGWGSAAERRKTAAAGFDRHLTKPVEPAVVEEILARPSSFHRTSSPLAP